MQAYTVCKQCDTVTDPYTLFRSLSKYFSEATMLESKDGNGRNNVASMLFLQNALRIEARGNRVYVTCLTDNGTFALKAMEEQLKSVGNLEWTNEGATIVFSTDRVEGDDITRIKAVYPSDVIRLFSHAWNLGTDEKQKRILLPGVFSYDFLDSFESLPEAKKDLNAFPDFCFYLPEEVVTLDHKHDTATVSVHRYGATSYDSTYKDDSLRADMLAAKVAAVEPGTPFDLEKLGLKMVPPDVAVDLADEEYAEIVKKLQGHIVKGDVFQIVPSRTFRTECDDPLTTYGVLRQLNPSPYLFYMKAKDFVLFGSSPETSVKVSGNPSIVSICPIAGTRKRGYYSDGSLDRDLDGRLESELKLNEKELAEHMMLVDLARNDVARVSKPGTRFVPQLLEVTRYSHVMHLVSVVEGELRDDLDALHAYLASANMGTLVGSPKIEAATLLRRHELDKRGPYGGAVGYISSDGEMDTCIVIRSALVKNGTAAVRAGAGVVYDSDPMAEAAETSAKAGAVLRAISLARGVTK